MMNPTRILSRHFISRAHAACLSHEDVKTIDMFQWQLEMAFHRMLVSFRALRVIALFFSSETLSNTCKMLYVHKPQHDYAELYSLHS